MRSLTSGYLGGALTIGGTTTFNSSAEIFSSGGDQTYTGAVILGADTNLGTFEGNVNFQSTVSGPHALAINTISDGTTTTLGEVGVGTNNALTSLSITGTSTINTMPSRRRAGRCIGTWSRWAPTRRSRTPRHPGLNSTGP